MARPLHSQLLDCPDYRDWHASSTKDLMHQGPLGLVKIGYMKRSKVNTLRASGIRVWIPKDPDIRPTSVMMEPLYMAFVEPWVIEMQQMYRKLAAGGSSYAGLTEWELVLAAAPEKDSG